MPHDHNHHDHGHSHAPDSFGMAFAIGIALNLSFVLAEVWYGLSAHSLALLADAGHNISDVLGLLMAWGATWLARCKPTARYTYGLQSSSILAAVANAMLLFAVTGGIIWEAIVRLTHLSGIGGTTIMLVAGVGIAINGITALLFMKGRKGDLNIRGAFLHMAADAVISLGVVISGFVILQTGWLWLDPLVSIVIAIVIMLGTWSLLRDSVNLALQAVPAHIDPANVASFLTRMEGVREVHDLHIWGMSTSEVALSVHLLMEQGHPGDAFIRHVAHEVDHQFAIGHTTIQIELGDDGGECARAPADVI